MRRIQYDIPVEISLPEVSDKLIEEIFFLGFTYGQAREQAARGETPILREIFTDFRNATGSDINEQQLYSIWRSYIDKNLPL